MQVAYTDELFKAARDLLVAGVAFLAYRTARDAQMSRWQTAWRGVSWCVGLALFAAVSLGQPSCEDQGDGLNGGCEQYADDGYEPSVQERLARFLYFFTLLSVPVLIGAAEEREK